MNRNEETHSRLLDRLRRLQRRNKGYSNSMAILRGSIALIDLEAWPDLNASACREYLFAAGPVRTRGMRQMTWVWRRGYGCGAGIAPGISPIAEGDVPDLWPQFCQGPGAFAETALTLAVLGLMRAQSSLSAIRRFGDTRPELLEGLALRRSPWVATLSRRLRGLWWTRRAKPCSASWWRYPRCGALK